VQQSRHVQERWQAAAEVKAFAQDMQPFVVQQATAGSDSLGSHFSARSSSSVTSSSSSSTTDRNSIAAATAAAAPQLPGDERQAEELIYGVTDVFMLSNPQEQYRLTLSALHSGQSKNLDQLAHMFDPQALLAGEARECRLLLADSSDTCIWGLPGASV
jgi:DNA-binding PucR family transcriptional regulator